jgi:anti-sigma factor RsiW
MTHCPFQPLLSAYHDRELSATTQGLLTRHLIACPACASALAALRDLSTQIAAVAADFDDDRHALANIHRAIDRAATSPATATLPTASPNPIPFPILRFTAPFAAIAASILIIGGVWLLDASRPTLPSGATVAASAPDSAPLAIAPDWERIAVTLRAEPRPAVIADSPFAPHYADAIHWMLDALAASDNPLTPEKPWPLPKSF